MTGPAEPSRGSSLAAVQEEIVAEMAGLDGMIQKYEYLVALGRALEVRDGSLRRDEHVVPGCQSRVWIRPSNRAVCSISKRTATP
jgi:sulfur transfer protein SufE